MTTQLLNAPKLRPAARGVHGSGWVGLEDFFDPTQKFGLVGLLGWLVGFKGGLKKGWLVGWMDLRVG